MRGQVAAVHKTGYEVDLWGERQFCIINNSFKSDEKPVVGDFVDVQKIQDQYFIQSIEERKNFIGRYDIYKNRVQGLASNVDWAIVVTSATREFSVNRIQRFLQLGGEQQINYAVILTKVDLIKKAQTYLDALAENFPDIPIIQMNALKKSEVEKIYDLVKEDESILFLGSSGVGKTTIINSLTGLQLRTKETKTGKFRDSGKHTTSARTLYTTPAGRKVIDIPGIKIIEVIPENLNYVKATRKQRFR
ncbi:MAG: GTPase RsgA [Firmicutes bacterium]|nr:GTPase RsgA [Bacillota bacterium]